MSIGLRLNRIAPAVEFGPHRHGIETIVYIAGGERVFAHRGLPYASSDDTSRRNRRMTLASLGPASAAAASTSSCVSGFSV